MINDPEHEAANIDIAVMHLHRTHLNAVSR